MGEIIETSVADVLLYCAYPYLLVRRWASHVLRCELIPVLKMFWMEKIDDSVSKALLKKKCNH